MVNNELFPMLSFMVTFSGMREAGGADYWVAFGAAMVVLLITRHLHMKSKASSKG